MNTRFNRILFDYDGTLIIHDKANEATNVAKLIGLDEFYMPEFSRRLNEFFHKHYNIMGRKITYEVYLENLERHIKIYRKFGIPAKRLADAMTYNSNTNTVLANSAKETLEYLVSRGYQLCVFTNGFYNAQVENMKLKGIYDYFEKVYAWDDFFAKPDTRAYFRALAKTDPSTNVMVGDTMITDILPAKEIGIYTIGINVAGQDMTQGEPDRIISDLSELMYIL